MQFQLKAIPISVISDVIAMHAQSEERSIHNVAAIFLQQRYLDDKAVKASSTSNNNASHRRISSMHDSGCNNINANKNNA